MKQVSSITVAELQEMATKMFGSIVKADVDVTRGLVIIDMGMHADGEAQLMEEGSKQNDLWGINLHPDKYGTNEFVEFDSMINLRPSQGNPSKDVLDPKVRATIIALIEKVVHD